MQFLGIHFAPLRIPIERRLQMLAAIWWCLGYCIAPFVFPIFSIWLLFFTRCWWLMLMYLIWIYLDRNICEKGGRPNLWIRSWKIWSYLSDYFPCDLSFIADNPLDPKRNYIFCCVPHGIGSVGVLNCIATNPKRFHTTFPHHIPHVSSLSIYYFMPFCREFCLSLGGIANTFAAIDYVLSKPEGGHIVVIIPGGAEEVQYTRPDQYKLVLKKRKGFVKLALKNGTPIVPVIQLGENDLYRRVDGPKIRFFLNLFENILWVPLVLINGRGIFQYSFGLIPRRRRITVLVGNPIDVIKTEHPSKLAIEILHGKFVEELKDLFEKYKDKYLDNSKNIHIEIVA